MSVLIKGMEMPTSCHACCFFGQAYIWESDFDGYTKSFCERTGSQTYDYVDKFLPNCPLVPVPPHGRLIDADELRQSIKESIDECHKWADEVEGGEMYARVSQSLGTFVECSLRVKAAPTIIPAEEGE